MGRYWCRTNLKISPAICIYKKRLVIFLIFQNHTLIVSIRIACETILMDTHNIFFDGELIEFRIKVCCKNRKVPKFSDARKLCCNLPKIQKKMPSLRVFHQKDADVIANSEDPDQSAPLGAV